MEFVYDRPPVPLEEVEPVEEIMKRFKTGAMSHGSIGWKAHTTLAIAMNRIGGRSNTGEGGEDPARLLTAGSENDTNSAIKQIASARFGVTDVYVSIARELQIKMAQGAKAGLGGQLAGNKVDPWIARNRHSTPGVELISPPPHHDIYSIEDLGQLVHDLATANLDAEKSVKLVSKVGVGTIASGCNKTAAHRVIIAGPQGGTGAKPLSAGNAGIPLELGAAETHQVLVRNGLRDYCVIEADGGLSTPDDILKLGAHGVEEFAISTEALIVMFCVKCDQCHIGGESGCPAGIATNHPKGQEKFKGTPEDLEKAFRFKAEEVRKGLAKLGYRKFDELVGQTNRLRQIVRDDVESSTRLDLSRILYYPNPDDSSNRVAKLRGQSYKTVYTGLDDEIIEQIRTGKRIIELEISNRDRSVGGKIAGERVRGNLSIPHNGVQVFFNGVAGQSFGWLLPKGLEFLLDGDAADYVGKSLSGGKIIVLGDIGNTAFYGATSGEGYIRGQAGQRFGVRNSGATIVAKTAGKHPFQLMSGGVGMLLGPHGGNLGSGLTGGEVFLLAERSTSEADILAQCNKKYVAAEKITTEQEPFVKALLRRFLLRTGSRTAKHHFTHWRSSKHQFWSVFPKNGRVGTAPNTQELLAADWDPHAALIAKLKVSRVLH